jgi:hypothetical protein
LGAGINALVAAGADGQKGQLVQCARGTQQLGAKALQRLLKPFGGETGKERTQRLKEAAAVLGLIQF